MNIAAAVGRIEIDRFPVSGLGLGLISDRFVGSAEFAEATRIVRFELNAGERSVRRATTIEASAPLVAHAAVTIAGDDLLYLSPVAAGATEFVAYRVHLK